MMNFQCGGMSFTHPVIQHRRHSSNSASSESGSEVSDSEISETDASDKEEEKFPSDVKAITLDKVNKIERILSLSDVVSLVFLLYKPQFALQTILVLLMGKLKQVGTDKITNWVNSRPKNWQSKLLEALTVIQHYQAVAMLGLTKEEVNTRFQPFIDAEKLFLCRVRRMLYRLMEDMTLEEAGSLISLIRGDEKFKGDQNHDYYYNGEYMELHLLYLQDINYINIREASLDLSNLLKHFDKKCLANNELLNLRVTDVEKMVQDLKKPRLLEIDDKDVYPIQNSENVGLVIIMNMENFHVETNPKNKHLLPPKPLEIRTGSSKDVENLKRTFVDLKFKVVEIHNVNSYHFQSKVDELVRLHFDRDHSVLFLCVLSHGSKGVVYCADSIPVRIEEVKSVLCETQTAMQLLAGKPKVIIVQACQGDNKLIADPKTEADPKLPDKPRSGPGSFSLDSCSSATLDSPSRSSPNYADLMLCMAIVQGYSAVRCPQKGTFYIQELCKMLNKYKDSKHFAAIVTKVQGAINNKEIHVKLRGSTGNCPDKTHSKNCCLIYMTPENTNSFTRDLYIVKNPRANS